MIFVNLDHIITYLNKSAKRHYKEGEKLLGTSIFDCHNENSSRIIIEIFEQMKFGVTEELISNDKKHGMYMRIVKDDSNKMIGYSLRFESPKKRKTKGV